MNAKDDDTQVELVRLRGGGRTLRITDPVSGIVLEKRLDPNLPVLRQKQRLYSVFRAAMAQAELSPA